jgi:hypothetical protein
MFCHFIFDDNAKKFYFLMKMSKKGIVQILMGDNYCPIHPQNDAFIKTSSLLEYSFVQETKRRI